MADNKKNIKNPRNPESTLYKKLTRLLSGPLVNRRTQQQRRYRRAHLDKYDFKSAMGLDFKKTSYNPYENLTANIMANQNRYERYIDFDQMECNNILQTYLHFGIEAARSCLIESLNRVFADQGVFLNYCHFSLLVDYMTSQGILTAMTRHGINKLDTDVLSRASFEDTIPVLINAAVFGESDSLKSVSSSIMLGKVPPVGSSSFDVLYSDELAHHSVDGVDYSSETEIYDEDEDELDERDVVMGKCAENNMGFAFNPNVEEDEEEEDEEDEDYIKM